VQLCRWQRWFPRDLTRGMPEIGLTDFNLTPTEVPNRGRLFGGWNHRRWQTEEQQHWAGSKPIESSDGHAVCILRFE
jgi:hypothetical protein